MNTKTILLVDDDEDDRAFFCDAVRDIDQSLILKEADNGLEALKQLRTKQAEPDIIFLDLNMPKMNGYECLEQIKEDEKIKNIPIVIYTTSKIYEEKERTFRMGAAYFLSKTADYLKLKTELRKILEQGLQ